MFYSMKIFNCHCFIVNIRVNDSFVDVNFLNGNLATDEVLDKIRNEKFCE